MSTYSIIAFLLTMATGIAYINHRYIKMQPTIAIMAASLLLSLTLIILGSFGINIHAYQKISTLINSFDFHDVLMEGMLSFLLFAGALNVDLNDLNREKWEIAALSIFSTVASCFLIATITYYGLPLFGVSLSYTYCLLFGALISPTDPIAVMATLKQINAPKAISVKIAGESLFNDGIAIVLFITIFRVAFGYTESVDAWSISGLFLQQAVGGVGFGILLGLMAYYLMKPIDDHKIEILITIAVATGGYSLAQNMEVSGPLAMVVAGLFIGNRGRNFAMSSQTQASLYEFWELIDEILNAILFLLIGFEILAIHRLHETIAPALMAVPMALAVRAVVVGIPMSLFKLKKTYEPYTTSIIIWGGLRGGLAVALALVIPGSETERSLILAMTYAIVLFSIIVQGTSCSWLIKRSKGEA
jgi:monovalent cation:H+ antiporter, CPA1 family